MPNYWKKIKKQLERKKVHLNMWTAQNFTNSQTPQVQPPFCTLDWISTITKYDVHNKASRAFWFVHHLFATTFVRLSSEKLLKSSPKQSKHSWDSAHRKLNAQFTQLSRVMTLQTKAAASFFKRYFTVLHTFQTSSPLDWTCDWVSVCKHPHSTLTKSKWQNLPHSQVWIYGA